MMQDVIEKLQTAEANRAEVYALIDQLAEAKREEQHIYFEQLDRREKRQMAAIAELRQNAIEHDANIVKQLELLGMIKNKLAGTEPLPLTIDGLRDPPRYFMEDEPRRRWYTLWLVKS